MFSRRVQPLAYRLYRPAAPKAVTVQRTDNGKAAPASGRPANPLATSSTASASSASVGFSRESVLLPSTPDQGFSSANLIGDGEAVGVGNQEKAGDAKAPAQPKDAEPKNDGDAGKPEQPQTSGKPEGSGNKPEDAGNSASGATGE